MTFYGVDPVGHCNSCRNTTSSVTLDLPGAITQRILENNDAIPVSKQDILATIDEVRNQNNHFDAAVPNMIMSASSDSGGLYDTWN